MKRSALVVVGAGMLAMVVLGGAGCTRVELGSGESPTRSVQDVALDGAASADVRVSMGAGVLQLDGDAASGTVLGCEFLYRPESWEPSVSQGRHGDTMSVAVEQQDGHTLVFGSNVRNEWNLSLTREIPVDLTLELGAGEAEIDLSGTRLRNLSVDCGAGDTSINLSGDWSDDVDARITTGVGRVALIVPESAGVRVQIERGVGDLVVSGLERDGDYYVNDAYGTAPVTLDITLECGVGSVEVRSE